MGVDGRGGVDNMAMERSDRSGIVGGGRRWIKKERRVIQVLSNLFAKKKERR